MTTITELRQLHQQASPPPWNDEPPGEDFPWFATDTDEDAALIAAMRNALPALLDIAEAAQRVCTEKEREPIKHKTGVSGKPRFVHEWRTRALFEAALARLEQQ